MTNRTGQIKRLLSSQQPTNWLFFGLTALLTYIAYERLSFTFEHLLHDSPLDLRARYLAVQQWFSGNGLYETHSSTYPPASHLLLWPVLGWLPFESVRWVWSLLIFFALIWIVLWCARADAGTKSEGVAPPVQRWFFAIYFLAMTCTSVAVWLGQLIPLLLVFLTVMARLLDAPRDEEIGWKREVAAGVLMLLALVKPSVSAPFFWILVWATPRPRAAVSVVLGYIALTLISLWFQKNGLQEVMDWTEIVNRNGAQLSEGYANLRVWMAAVGLKAWSHPASLLIFVGLGAWTRKYRNSALWLRLGVVGLIARLWTYHNSYDDMLLILPMLALLEIAAKNHPKTTETDNFWTRVSANLRNEARQAQLLLAIWSALLLLLPSWLFQASIWGMSARGLTGLTMIWTLGFSMRFASQETLQNHRIAKVK